MPMMTLDRREASFVLLPVEQPSQTMNLFSPLLFSALKNSRISFPCRVAVLLPAVGNVERRRDLTFPQEPLHGCMAPADLRASLVQTAVTVSTWVPYPLAGLLTC